MKGSGDIMKFQKTKRYLSLALSAVMALSAISAGISAAAEGETDTTIKDVTTPYFAGKDIEFPEGGNNLKGQFCKASFYMDGVETDENAIYQPSEDTNYTWFNSDGTDDCVFGGDGTYSKNADNSVEQTSNYWSLKFKIDGVLNNPQKFILGFHKESTGLMSQHYAVFASENYADLGNKKIIEIIGTWGRSADSIDVSGLNLTNIKYVEVRIYHRAFHSAGEYSYQHINELGFFGGSIKKSNAVTNHSVKNLSEIDLSENRLANADVVTGFYGDNVLTGEKGLEKKDLEAVLDSNIPTGDFSNAFGHFHGNADECQSDGYDNSVFQTDSYWQMQFSFDGYLKSPDRFVFSARKDGNLMSQHYAVFASDDISNLYDDGNKIIEITDISNRVADEVLIPDNNLTVRYVGIRFYHRGYTQGNVCSMQFLTKVGLYGGTYVESTAHTTYPDIWWVVADEKAYNDKTFSGVNRLRGQKVTRTFVKNGEATPEKSDNDPPYYNGLVDSSALGRWHTEDNTCYSKDAPNDILQTNSYWQMEAELSAPIDNPDYFSVIFHPESKTLSSQHYAVYASDSADTLYNDEHKIIEIIDQTERIGDSVDLSGMNLENISYIGIRFYHRAYSMPSGCSLQHISEIGIYGGTLKNTGISASESLENSGALTDGTATGAEIAYNDGFAWYEASFTEKAINNVTLYFEDTAKLPQDIGIDVKVGDKWKRVAEKHNIAYNGDKSADFWFASVEGATAVRIMASNARNASNTFALSEIQVGNDIYYKEQNYTGIAKPESFEYRSAIAGDVNNDLTADAEDLAILRKYLLTEEYDGYSSLDSNYDGNINILDLVSAKKAIK